MYIRSEQRP